LRADAAVRRRAAATQSMADGLPRLAGIVRARLPDSLVMDVEGKPFPAVEGRTTYYRTHIELMQELNASPGSFTETFDAMRIFESKSMHTLSTLQPSGDVLQNLKADDKMWLMDAANDAGPSGIVEYFRLGERKDKLLRRELIVSDGIDDDAYQQIRSACYDRGKNHVSKANLKIDKNSLNYERQRGVSMSDLLPSLVGLRHLLDTGADNDDADEMAKDAPESCKKCCKKGSSDDPTTPPRKPHEEPDAGASLTEKCTPATPGSSDPAPVPRTLMGNARQPDFGDVEDTPGYGPAKQSWRIDLS
tara:strand:- start:679 stop:1590 length:912 start_codon:yes stop_codon:yes gene_type:complete